MKLSHQISSCVVPLTVAFNFYLKSITVLCCGTAPHQ